jgi:nucleoid-associated protein YgaU
VQLYEKALKVNPGLAAGHLDLAMLLHDDVGDYVGAICHYRLYLDLRPDAAKSDMIQNRMNDAVIRLAASAREADNGLAKDAGESLLRENEALRQEIRRLRAAASQEGGRVAVTNTLQTVGSAADGAVRPAGPRQYVVKSGDTLGTIARDMYGNVAEWKKIHAANKEALSGPDLLVVGQVLMIP